MANPATGPEVAVADIIVAAGVTIAGVVAAKGTNLFHGPIEPAAPGTIPHAGIWAVAVGGPINQAYIGNSEDFREFVVQITTRSNVGDFATGLATARAAWVALQRASGLPADYFGCQVREPDPVYIGKDDQEHHRWTNNIRLWYSG